MPLPPTHKARLAKKVKLTHDTRDFYFELLEPDTSEFAAGQFMLIKTNHPETGELISRAYSIVNSPSEKHTLRFCINIVPNGKLTSLIETWEEGHEVEIQGPFGHFTMKSPEDRELVFVATGTGIAPLRSMITDLLEKGDPRKISLYFGVRHETDIYYKEDFEKLAADHENFEFTLTLSQPKEDWSGSKGRVTAILPEIDFHPSLTDVYICGGKAVIDDVKDVFLKKGILPEQIFFEQYFL